MSRPCGKVMTRGLFPAFLVICAIATFVGFMAAIFMWRYGVFLLLAAAVLLIVWVAGTYPFRYPWEKEQR